MSKIVVSIIFWFSCYMGDKMKNKHFLCQRNLTFFALHILQIYYPVYSIYTDHHVDHQGNIQVQSFFLSSSLQLLNIKTVRASETCNKLFWIKLIDADNIFSNNFDNNQWEND